MACHGSYLFGKYRLLRRLAMGGMAEIFQAHLVGAAGFVRDVVIKRIHPDMSDDDDFVQMFINEARLAAKLHHPNIVQVLDFDQIDGNYYIAMEFIDGLDLKQLRLQVQKTGKMIPVSLSVLLVIEALKGLSYAHNLRYHGDVLHIVHRDISPQNILVSQQGQVKVADFGIARVMQHASMTAKGVLKGKLGYMAPEQTHSSRVDTRADLFSMGVVLWELLCGERLFRANSHVQLIEMVRTHPIVPPHMKNPNVSEELSAIVMQALAREPEKRVQDASTMAKKLQPWSASRHDLDELGQMVRNIIEKTRATQTTHTLGPGDRIDSEEVSKPSSGTAQLKDWSPPPPEQRCEETQDLHVVCEKDFSQTEPSLSQELPHVEKPGSWGSFPTLDASELSSPHAKREVGLNDWMVKTDEIVPSEMIHDWYAQEAKERPAPDHEPADDTVQINPAEILASVAEQRPTYEPDELSTVLVEPQLYLREMSDFSDKDNI